MTVKEVEDLFEEMRSKGLTDNQIVNELIAIFRNGQINAEQLDALMSVMGCGLNPDFINLPHNKQMELIDRERRSSIMANGFKARPKMSEDAIVEQVAYMQRMGFSKPDIAEDIIIEFKAGHMGDAKELELFLNALGYDLDPNFKKLPYEKQKQCLGMIDSDDNEDNGTEVIRKSIPDQKGDSSQN